MFSVVRMSCEARLLARIAWFPLAIVLLLAALPRDAFAHSPVCRAIRPGESATQAARRVTGNGLNAYQTWFHIMNPSSRFVPKSQYDRIRPGWRACVIKPAVQNLSSTTYYAEASGAAGASEAPIGAGVPEAPTAPTALAGADAVDRAGDSLQPGASDIFPNVGSVDLTMLWLGAAMAVSWFGWRIVDEYLARRKTASIIMRYFVRRFVDEFERPLVRYDVGERPVRACLRWRLRRERFDILLAPGVGRRYPNLSDHRKNVEYDVARVMHVLEDDSFVNGAPYAQSGWIVVPFQFRAGPKQSGVTCISSL
jgi:hypothetical protein